MTKDTTKLTKKCEEFSQKVSSVEKMFEEMSKEKKFLLELDKEQRKRLLEVLAQSEVRFPCLGPVITKLGQMVEKEDPDAFKLAGIVLYLKNMEKEQIW